MAKARVSVGPQKSKASANTVQRDEEARAHAMKAHRTSTQGFRGAVSTLVERIGVQLTAYIGTVEETRAVRQWIDGTRVPHRSAQTKLRIALQISELFRAEGEEESLEAWFQGLNPALNDHSPAELLHATGETELLDVGREVLAAAREFVSG